MFRFTIRDVLWLTLVVALIFGWCIDHQLQNRRHRRELNALEDEQALKLHEWTNP